jgi:hypothetical protein
MRPSISAIALTALILSLLQGCGSNTTSVEGLTVPVKGKIIYKGKPLTAGTVVFEPEDAGRDAHGKIQSDGTFELSTYKTGDGAVRGPHRVAVEHNLKIPVKYKNVSSSKIEVEVTDKKSEYVVNLP